MRALTQSRAFTLLELLIVVGILSIFSALTGGVMKNIRARARATVCLNNLHQLGLAIRLYSNDNDERFPYPSSYGFGPEFGWYHAIDPYMSGQDVGSQRRSLAKQDPIFERFPQSWSTNVHTIKMNQNLGYTNGVAFFASFTGVSHPEWTVLLFDGRAELDALVSGAPSAVATRMDGTEGHVARRHSERANVLFVDGHAELRNEKHQTTGTMLGWEVDGTSLIWQP